MTVLLLIAAIVLDLGATRSDRRGGQLAADNASTAAARALPESGAVQACEDALDYLEVSLETGTFTNASGLTCTTQFSTDCIPAAPVVNTLPVSSGDFDAVITHAVLDTSPLMQKTSTIGAGTFGGVTAGDEGPCDRIAVEVTTRGDDYFGGIAGSDGRRSTVHAVAIGKEITGTEQSINLLILNRTDCQSLIVRGGAQVTVAAPPDDPSTPTVDESRLPGILGVDAGVTTSSSTCGGGRATFEVSGSSWLRAQGRCESDPLDNSCGIVALYTPVTDGSCTKDGIDVPACTVDGGDDATSDLKITPDAITAETQSTRREFDYRYNCKSSYVYEPWYATQPIGGCGDSTSTTDYVDDLKVFAAGFSTVVPDDWTTVSDCNPGGIVNFPPGNYYVDCPTFRVNAGGVVSFKGGNVVFGGSVEVPGSATLNFNTCTDLNALLGESCPSELTTAQWQEGLDFDEDLWSRRNAWIYVDDQFNAQGNVAFNNVTAFFGNNGYWDKSGSGTVLWEAPDEESTDDSAGPFDDLAMWSEGTAEHIFQGGGTSDWEGVFFGPRATFGFAGSTPMLMEAAQFASDKMEFRGSTTYRMNPVASRSVATTLGYTMTLIR